MSALRVRAIGGILVFVESRGRNYLYDEQLSIIRVNAARANKRPGVSWKEIENTMKRLDLDGHLNRYIKEQLNRGGTEAQVTRAVQEMIQNELSK